MKHLSVIFAATGLTLLMAACGQPTQTEETASDVRVDAPPSCFSVYPREYEDTDACSELMDAYGELTGRERANMFATDYRDAPITVPKGDQTLAKIDVIVAYKREFSRMLSQFEARPDYCGQLAVATKIDQVEWLIRSQDSDGEKADIIVPDLSMTSAPAFDASVHNECQFNEIEVSDIMQSELVREISTKDGAEASEALIRLYDKLSDQTNFTTRCPYVYMMLLRNSGLYKDKALSRGMGDKVRGCLNEAEERDKANIQAGLDIFDPREE